MAYLYDLTDTWNAAGTVFNAIKMNVTNTASAAGSKIVSLQVGATDRFTVDKDGNGYFSGTLQAVGSISSPNAYLSGNSGTIGMQDNTASILAYNGTGSGGITNTLRFITGAAERMRITSAGNVGIGTSSPTQKLTVSGAVNADNFYIQTQSASQAGTVGFANANGPGIQFWGSGTGNAGSLTFNTASSERMRITGAGNVGIGTSSPAQKLDVNGQMAATGGITVRGNGSEGGQISLTNAASSADAYFFDVDGGGNGRLFTITNNTNLTIGQLGGTGGAVLFATSASERMRIDTSGNVGIGTSAPNAKLDVVGNVVMGAALTTGTGVSTGDVQVELGANRTGDGPCYVDWHSTAGTDFESRIVRNSGANGTMDIFNTGTGGINLSNFGSAPITLATGGIDRMRVTSTGNVGIGTSSPGATLHISVAQPRIQLTDTDTGANSRINADSSSGGLILEADLNNTVANSFMAFSVDGSERARIGSTGNVGIGTTSPAQRIHAATTAAPTGTTQSFLRLTGDATFGADFGGGLIQGTGPIATISTVNAGTATERMRIDSSGNVGIGTSSPQGLLHVVAGTNDTLLFRGPVNLGTGGSIYAVNSANSAVTPMEFGASVYYFAGGNVGINESAPDYKLDVNGTFGFTPGSSVTPVDNGDVVFELTNNTTLTIKAKGSDGVVRSGTITLA